MSRSPILFRCDGTYEQGWEPFYQCMTLAQAIQRRRRATYFHSRLDPANLALTIHRGGHEWLPADHAVGCTDDLDATVRQARKVGAAAVVVVAPNISVEYLRELNATRRRRERCRGIRSCRSPVPPTRCCGCGCSLAQRRGHSHSR